MDTETTPMITPSEVIEYLYCPRFIYFMHCLIIPQHEEKRYKVIVGREIHKKKEEENRKYLRKKLGCVKKEISVYLASKHLGIRGVIDEVMFLSDGTLSPLDYKYAEYSENTFNTYKVQSTLYAMLIRDNYNKEVKKGYLCYARSNFKLKEIVYTDNDYSFAKKKINEVFDVIIKGVFPKKTGVSSRCFDCCYKNVCVK